MRRAEARSGPVSIGQIPLLPHQLTEDVTPREDVIVLCHLGVPRLDAASWEMQIDGLVSKPARLRLDDLRRFPQRRVESFHQCAGSPLAPQEPKRRIVNVRWGGVRVSDVLADCGVRAEAQVPVVAWRGLRRVRGRRRGALHQGPAALASFGRCPDCKRAEWRAAPAENGFPARLVVPGFYGTNSVKWLTGMTLADRRSDSPFTTRWYNDAVLDGEGRATGQTVPVWAIAPESVIVAPAPEARSEAGQEHVIWGRAWADGGVSRVKVSVDGGAIVARGETGAARWSGHGSGSRCRGRPTGHRGRQH